MDIIFFLVSFIITIMSSYLISLKVNGHLKATVVRRLRLWWFHVTTAEVLKSFCLGLLMVCVTVAGSLAQ